MSDIRKILKEWWHRFWCKVFGYEWSFPYCNRLTCPLNKDQKCRIEVRLPYWKQVRFDKRYCPLSVTCVTNNY